MNGFILFTAVIFLSSLAQAMDNAKPWFRVHESKRCLEVPFKTYFNMETKKTIRALGMSHVGIKDFYIRVNELITGKIVLYELLGQDWEQVRREQEAIRQLDEVYQNRYKLSGMNSYSFLANHHKISCQIECLNYDVALKHFHADLQSDEILPLSQSNLKNRIDTFINQRYADLVDHFGLPADEKNIDKKAEAIFRALSKQLPDLKSLIPLLTQSAHSRDHQKRYIQNRNPILEQKTLELLLIYDELVITYGGTHFPDFELFLLRQGFQLQAEDWMTVFEF